MNRNIAEKWIAALESGEFQQGREGLRIKGFDGQDKFCCLGVLCEIAVREGVGGQWGEEDPTGRKMAFITPDDEDYGTLPERVKNWAGMKSYNGSYGEDEEFLAGYSGALSMDNDTGATFTQIAETIRQRVDEL